MLEDVVDLLHRESSRDPVSGSSGAVIRSLVSLFGLVGHGSLLSEKVVAPSLAARSHERCAAEIKTDGVSLLSDAIQDMICGDVMACNDVIFEPIVDVVEFLVDDEEDAILNRLMLQLPTT